MGFGGDVTVPSSVIYVDDNTLTLRDRFAIAALCGPVSDLTGTAEEHAQIAYEYADAMMEARNKK